MIAADSDCILPTTMMPPGPGQDCYLSPGEVPAGSAITEVTGFDFNVFIYDRMTPQQWMDTMQHTFLLHYYGDRAPFTYGAHPVEYTSAYDDSVLTQANNYGYADVVKYSTYLTRQAALTQFIQWIATDPVLSQDTYFMSGGGLVKYMQNPTDKTGKPVAPDTVASPDSNGIFTLKWSGTGATISTVSGNAANIVFNVAAADDDPVTVSTTVPTGSLKGVSHIDIEYTSEVPFRIRLLTGNGTISTTALLAGVGGDRLARIRIRISSGTGGVAERRHLVRRPRRFELHGQRDRDSVRVRGDRRDGREGVQHEDQANHAARRGDVRALRAVASPSSRGEPTRPVARAADALDGGGLGGGRHRRELHEGVTARRSNCGYRSCES